MTMFKLGGALQKENSNKFLGDRRITLSRYWFGFINRNTLYDKHWTSIGTRSREYLSIDLRTTFFCVICCFSTTPISWQAFASARAFVSYTEEGGRGV